MGRAPSFGVIAEDQTDCKALCVIINRLLGEDVKVRQKHGRGCARARRKARAWANDLVRRGCSAVIMVHDLDRDPNNGQLNDEAELRSRLEAAFTVPAGVGKYICIPKEELEAWFWSDVEVLRLVARDPQFSEQCHEPEDKKTPKEALMRLSRDAGGKARYSTNDNPSLASRLDLDLCALRCPAFHEIRRFIRSVAP